MNDKLFLFVLVCLFVWISMVALLRLLSLCSGFEVAVQIEHSLKSYLKNRFIFLFSTAEEMIERIREKEKTMILICRL